jgi:hypothetical protein
MRRAPTRTLAGDDLSLDIERPFGMMDARRRE